MLTANPAISRTSITDNAPGVLHMPDHSQCVALSNSFRGKLCEDLANRPARSLAAGEVVYRTGSAALTVYLVRSGRVKTAVISPAGEELTLRIHRSGDVFGELCLCAGDRREQAVAMEPSEVVAITLSMLADRVRNDPVVAMDLTSLVCEHLAAAYDRLHSFSADNAMHRLARTLLDLATESGAPGSDGTIVIDYLSQQELAHLIGARREVVSSLLNQLRYEGLIRYGRLGPITVDPRAVRAFLDEDGHS